MKFENCSQKQNYPGRGYTPGHFSFNVKGGRCEACRSGARSTRNEHYLMFGLHVTYTERGTQETLEVTWKGKNIHDILEMLIW